MADSKGTTSTSAGLRGDARAEWLTTNRDAARILEGYIQKAEALFRARAQAAGLNLTGEMLSRFKSYAATEAEGYVEARLSMSTVARVRDLQSMNYSRTPPILAMIRMVENTIEKKGRGFYYRVPGYPDGVWPASETAGIERIAWAAKMFLRRYPNVKRGYRGIYSDPLLADVLPYLFRDLLEAAGQTAVRGMKLAVSFN